MKIKLIQISHIEEIKGEKLYDWTSNHMGEYPLITEETGLFLKKIVTYVLKGFPKERIIINEELLSEHPDTQLEGSVVMAIEHRDKTYVFSRSILQKKRQDESIETNLGDFQLITEEGVLQDEDLIQEVMWDVLSEIILKDYI